MNLTPVSGLGFDAIRSTGLRPWPHSFAAPRLFLLEVAAGFEIGTPGALELAFFLVELCPAVRAGAFDLFQIGRVTCAGRHAAYRPVVLCQSIRRDGRES